MSANGVPSITHQWVDLPERGRLHVATCGDGPPIIFLHGFPEFWLMWERALLHFGRTHRAIAPDQRGFNLSFKPADVRQYRAKVLVQDVLLLADALGHDRFVLVAHDWGGAIAWNVAAWHPERVEKLVILNAPHPVTFARELRDSPAQRAASAYMTLFRDHKAERVLAEDGYRRLRRMTLEQWGANGGPADAATVEAYLTAWAQPGALTGMLDWYRASPLHPPEPGASVPELDVGMFRVHVPTLVLWGERDEALLPGMLDGLDTLVDDLRVERVPDASHWIVHERPDRVLRAIDDFLACGAPPARGSNHPE